MEHPPRQGGVRPRVRAGHYFLVVLTTLGLLVGVVPGSTLAQVFQGASQPLPYQGAPAGVAPAGQPVGQPDGGPVPGSVVSHDGGVPSGAVMQPPTGQPAPPAAQMDDKTITAAEAKKMIDAALKAHDEKTRKDAEEKKKTEAPPWYAIGTKLDMNATWRNGVWFETPNKDFTLHIGGTVQYDLALYSADSNLEFGPRGVGAFNDGVNLRRGRLRTEGSMWEVLDYRFELEFFNGVTPPGTPADAGRATQGLTFVTPSPTDAWLTFTKLPIIGNIRIGNQKEPISLEHLESYRFLPFLERSPLFDFLTPTAFNNGFSPGIMAFDALFDDRMTWAVGIFKNTYDGYGFGLGDGEYAVTGRLTALPWYEDDGACMVHLGVAGSHRDPIDDQVRFRVRSSVRNAPAPLTPFVNVLIDTGFINATAQDLMGLEFFMNLGPLTVQAEWQASWNQNTLTTATGPVGTTFFQGYYVQALYWLTGEHTRWDRKAAAPDRPIPNSPFFLVSGPDGWLRGTGAWQVGVRYSSVDLNSRGVNGGTLGDLTVGLNWILNPNAKLQWNYGWEHRGGFNSVSNGDMHALGMRMQFDF
ncbi:MAG: hypothetical protein IT429_03515 [Gemmataceae bacterium]|nr:hypothetical protein [Gemmataceae bacterium]